MTDLTAPRRASSPTVRRRMRPWLVGLNTAAAWIVGIGFLFPLIWMFFTALKPANEVFSQNVELIGSAVLWSNFADAWESIDFGILLRNIPLGKRGW